jgi:hypothetical protein
MIGLSFADWVLLFFGSLSFDFGSFLPLLYPGLGSSFWVGLWWMLEVLVIVGFWVWEILGLWSNG